MSTEKGKRCTDRRFDGPMLGVGPLWKLIRRWFWGVYLLALTALAALWWFRRPETPWNWLTLGALWFALFLAHPGVIRATEDSNWDSLYYRANRWLRYRWNGIWGDVKYRRMRRLEEAVEGAVTAIYPVRKPDYLWVDTKPEGFPDYCYAVVRNGTGPVIGGPAFVVEKDTLTVHEVSGSVPPRVNCQTVADRSSR